jgi:hypothetical protein
MSLRTGFASACLTLGVMASAANAADYIAASCNPIDIQYQINVATVGDRVLVPSGSCTWTSGVTITTAITLRPVAGAVTIRNNATTPNASGTGSRPLIAITESTAGTIRVQGFTFVAGTGPTGVGAMIDVTYKANGQPVLIVGNTFTTFTRGVNALYFKTNRGVISGNTFTGQISGSSCVNNSAALRHKPFALTSSWSTASKMGANDTDGTQNLYFERNSVSLMLEGIDVDDNARTVVRYNTFTNSPVAHHGNDTSPYGARYSEIYNNTFVWDPSPQPTGGCSSQITNLNWFITLRGGTSVIHHNVIPDINSQAWGNKKEVNLRVENVRRDAGPYPCYGTKTPGTYPVPHQVGQGSDSSGARILEPVYLWNNTGAGNYPNPLLLEYSPNECGSAAHSIVDYLLNGHDFLPGTPRSNYVPFVYPHPLTSSSVLGAPMDLRVE